MSSPRVAPLLGPFVSWGQIFLRRPTTLLALMGLAFLGRLHPAAFDTPHRAPDLALLGAIAGAALAVAAVASIRSTLEIMPPSNRRVLEFAAVFGAAAAFGISAGAAASGRPTATFAAVAAVATLASLHLAALAQYLLRTALAPTSSALALLALTWAAPAVLPAAAARVLDPRPANPADIMLAAGILLGGWHLPYASRLRS